MLQPILSPIVDATLDAPLDRPIDRRPDRRLDRRPALALLLGALVAAAFAAPGATAQTAGDGRLVIMGGGGFGAQPDVYHAILEARQGAGPVCVIPTASATPEGSLQSAVNAFDRHGGAGTAVGIPELTVDTPESAHDPAVVEALGRCSGYYFVGGVQSRIVTVLRPGGESTPALEALMRRFREGAVVSGSSAGAAIMSDPMISGGASGAMAGGVRRSGDGAGGGDEPPAGDGLASVQIQPGLGFFPDGLVDQHFLARGRIGRLLVAVLETAEFDLGFGIDESTALVVEGGTAWAVGASAVVVVDAAAARAQDGATTGVTIHLMSPGDRFLLEGRRLTLGAEKRELPAGAAVAPPENLFSSWTFLHLLDGLARAPQSEIEIPVPGGRIVLRKPADFAARRLDGEGVRGTAAGLSLANLQVDLRRTPN